jgi:hypothetical protein
MTTRLTKVVDGAYVARTQGTQCSQRISTFQECFHAAASTLGGGGRSFKNATGSDAARPAGCSATVDPAHPLEVAVFFNRLASSTASCGAATGQASAVSGVANSLVRVSVALSAKGAGGTATITLTGNASVWFGVGIGAADMQGAYAIIVEGGASGGVSERKLGKHLAGTQLKPSITVKSSSVSDGLRTVVLTRPLNGAGESYYSFSASSDDATLKIITAVGTGPQLAYHRNKALTSLAMLPAGGSAGGGACVCPEAPKPFGQASGALVYHAVANQSVDVGLGQVGFRAGKCAQYPATTQIPQRNPTCDIRAYVGGQWACHHMWSLLDAEQEIPWPDQPLILHHKYRFWVQPFTKSYHVPVHYGGGSQLLIGSPWEYDVPKCAHGVAGCSLVNGTWIHTVTGSKYNNEEMVTLNMHCHAPTCLSMSVWACPDGTSLNDCANATSADEARARGYKLLCQENPVYGGSDNPLVAGSRFDEDGYIAIPDCLWGSAEHGLVAPINTTGVPLFILKTANASNGHYGEMAGGQPFCA